MTNVCVIGCWYRDDMYSHHLKALLDGVRRQSANRSMGVRVRLVTSNCNCYSSAQRVGIDADELLDADCRIVKLPFAPLEPNKKYGIVKYYLVKYSKLNYFLETLRGVSFFFFARKAQIIHFDQVLRAFGVLSFSVLLFLSRIFGKKVICTVHELDPLQEKYIGFTRYYNRVDKLIVFSRELEKHLVDLGVASEKIEVLPYAVAEVSLNKRPRDGFVFFGGHKLLVGKGFDTLLDAIEILTSQGLRTRVHIYTGHGCSGIDQGKEKVAEKKLDEFIVWSNFLHGEALNELYQQCVACIIPYTGGSGRHPVTAAMENATPVIATRKAGLPEYLGDLGLYINVGSGRELAAAMLHLSNNPDQVASLGEKLRNRAHEFFTSWIVSQRLIGLYTTLDGS